MQSTDSQPAESRKSVSREEVKLLAISVGVREAAKQIGLNENTVLSWSKRDKWFVDPPKPATLTKQKGQAISAITSPSEVLITQLRDDSEQTKLSLSRSVRRGAKALEAMPDIVPFTAADKVKHLVGAASQLHGWEQSKESGHLDINVLAGGRAMIQVVQGDQAKP